MDKSFLLSWVGRIWWQILIGIGIWFIITILLRNNPKSLMKRIEKDAIKVIGVEPAVYLKRSKTTGECRVINVPIKIETIPRKSDGSFDYDIDWKGIVNYDNVGFFFGSKKNAFIVLGVVALTFLLVFGVLQIIADYNRVVETCNLLSTKIIP